MGHIAILSASVRNGRASHRVALYLQRRIAEHAHHTADLIDLREHDFPIFHERLKFMDDPAPDVVAFADRVRQADGVIIVTPEYNGGMPAALKNVVDLLTQDWRGKPIALAPVSDGAFGGTQVVTQLLFNLWKIRAWVVPGAMQVPTVKDQFQEDGTPEDDKAWARRSDALLEGLTWAMEATARMKA
ncbi:MAG: NAD(P)H-dependent oxidoreductase [Flavobacteriales bacterium]|nr:NAD(P)H-dependent oxidoreductase [Flavobacteriales bacterium]